MIFIHYSEAAKAAINNILQLAPDIPVILLASRLDKGFIAPMFDKIKKVIYKPIYASKIIGAIIDILSNSEEASKPEKPEEELHLIPFSAEALVAEDNTVNQRLIALMLKEIGVYAVIVNNGLEVVESFKNKKYDIVLMDVNMPIVDGIEATAKILEMEKAKGLRHTPIIALTAKTIRGDREIILNSGMDDYLSKPISIKKLYGILYPFLKDTQKEKISIISEDHMAADINSNEYSIASTAGELGVSIEFLRNLIEQFINNFEKNCNNITKSLKDAEYDNICFEAHKLKGTAANLRFNDLAALLSQIETNARGKNNINYNELLDKVIVEFESLKKKLSFLHQ
jgi:CheY-like chemotaxis protein